MTDHRRHDDKPPRVSIDGDPPTGGLLFLMGLACAFILGLIVGTLIWWR